MHHIVLALAALAVLGTEPHPGVIPTPLLHHVSLGSTEAAVAKHLGRPQQARVLPSDLDLGMGELKELSYPGLLVGLNRPPGTAEFRVHSLTVSAAKWSFSNGLKVGLSRARVLQLLGANDESQSPAELVYLLSDRDGRVVLEFRREKLVVIALLEDNA